MWMIGVLFGLFVFITALVMPWVNQNQIKSLRETIEHLQRQIDRLRTEGAKPEPTLTVQMPHVYEKKQNDEIKIGSAIPVESRAPLQPQFPDIAASTIPRPESVSRPAPVRETIHATDEGRSRTFEQQFGGRAFVWLGGVALALAGFFMVKYSIETGLLSPAVRVTLGLIFGVVMLGAGYWMNGKPEIANNVRIGQALSGAAIADLYACLFAGTTLYNLIPTNVGFAAMAAVTAVAVVLSLRQGMPIAVLGLIGGFLTPALIDSASPSAPLLFLYLYFVLTGLMVAIRKQGWWPLAIPAVLGGFVWVLIWMFSGNFAPSDSLWLGLFLMAMSVTIVATLQPREDGDEIDYFFVSSSAFNYLALGCSIGLMGLTAARGGFGMMEWGLFGLISLGSVGLAAFNQRLYGMAPWLSMAVCAVMLMVWPYSVPQDFALVLVSFAILYIVPAVFLRPRSQQPWLWAGLIAATSLGYYLIGYYELHTVALIYGIPMFWGLLAFGCSACAIIGVQEVMQSDDPQKQYLLAIYTGLATAFLSIGLSIEMKHEFLSVAFAAEALAIAWINTRVNIKALRSIVGVLAGVFGILLVPQILLIVQLAVYSLVEAKLPLQEGIPIVDWPLFQLGAPAALFILASFFLRKQKDDLLVRSLEVAAIALIGVMGYYLTRHAFHVDENVLFVKAGFIERGVITNILFIYGLACLWIGRTFTRQAVTRGGIVLAGVALFRIGYFDLLAHNPLWSEQKVGALPIFNALLLTYGLPTLWTWQMGRELEQMGRAAWSKYGYGVMLLLAFCLLSFEVRQFYHGALLNGSMTSDAEIYTYSAAWLLFGIALLFLGTLRQDRMTRIASLGILLLTVGKVFLYDASELTGLWRVFSFFGLGLSLLGLSWFYSRFVFGSQKQGK